ncbi:MAG: PA2169 family four-helix-bundle protein [Lewinellaceae bacterium]|nr:PA2169 family four-helix-bundle protein [Lewinellaceae bacterium]
MQNNNEALADTFNELIRINFDRVYGYEKAVAETEQVDIDLKAIFNEYADMSREYIAYWQQQVRSLGEEPASDSTVRGKVYRVWMDVKSAVTNHDRESILNSCAFGEKAAIDAYEDALSTNTHLPDEYRLAIVDQKSKLQAAHNKIEMYANVNEKIG